MNKVAISEFEAFAQQVELACKEAQIPGVVVGIQLGSERFTRGIGVTNVDHPLTVTENTIFQIGSITKTYTAILILRLVADGLVELDAPVRKYLPDFRVQDEDVSAKVTVRQLLTHTAGWSGDVFLEIDKNDTALKTYTEALKDTPQILPSGKLFSYNNAAFSVAGYIIEVVTGKTYEQAVAEYLFEPMGLHNSYFFPDEIITRRFAVGHVQMPDGHKVQRPWSIPRTAISAGAIACDVQDLLRYATYFMEGDMYDGEPILEPELKKEMLTSQFPIWESSSMGLSWFINEVDGVKTIQHGGGTLGQVSLLTIAPEHNFAFAIMANSSSALPIIDEANRNALKNFVGVEEPVPQIIEHPDFDVERFVGKYSRPNIDIEITLDDGNLMAQLIAQSVLQVETEAPKIPPLALGVCSENQLMFNEGPYKGHTLDFITDDNNIISWMCLGQCLQKKV